jgi:hypothetical protein
MVKEIALKAINTGSKMLMMGELASVAEETPNKDAIGLAQTPTQAPLLQHDNKTGVADVKPPVMLVQNDFFAFITLKLLLVYNTSFSTKMPHLPIE